MRHRSRPAARVVLLGGLLNLSCFGIEFAVALAIGPVALFADSIDFLWASAWPDLVVGLAIAAMNADAARDVWAAALENIAWQARSHSVPAELRIEAQRRSLSCLRLGAGMVDGRHLGRGRYGLEAK